MAQHQHHFVCDTAPAPFRMRPGAETTLCWETRLPFHCKDVALFCACAHGRCLLAAAGVDGVYLYEVDARARTRGARPGERVRARATQRARALPMSCPSCVGGGYSTKADCTLVLWDKTVGISTLGLTLGW